MKVKVIGVEPRSFPAKEGGGLVEMNKIVYAYVDAFKGLVAKDKLVKKIVPLPEGLVFGADADIQFNEEGKVVSVTLLKA